MDFPTSVTDIVYECTHRNPSNVRLASNEALEQIKALEEYPSLVDKMLSMAVKDLINQERQKHNKKVRNSVGSYHTERKVPAQTQATKQVDESVYTMFIFGTQVQHLMGKDFAKIIHSSNQSIKAHRVYVRFCEELTPLVPEDRTVKQSLSEQQVQEIYKRVRSEVYGNV